MWCKRILKNSLRTFCSKVVQLKPTTSSSPIAEIFNAHLSRNGVSGGDKKTGLFNVPELKTPFGFVKLQEECIIQTEQLIHEALSTTRSRKMVEIFDEMSDSLCRVADLAEFIRLAHPAPQYNEAAEKVCLIISKIVEELNTNRPLYDNLKKNVTEGDIKPTSEVDSLVGELFLFDFEQNGIHLSEDLRNKVVMLNNDILNLGQQFVAGSDSPRIVRKSAVSPNILHLFSTDGDNIVVSGLCSNSSSSVAREMTYKIYYYPDKHQEFILKDLIKSRYDLARICGFNSYAERVLKGGMVDNTSDVMDFLEKTSNEINKFSISEVKLLNKIKNADNLAKTELAVWDVPYYMMKAKSHWFNVSQEEYAPYFSLGACMEGLNLIFNHLFGISLVNSPISEGECWCNDVYKLAVEHETEGVLGYIYCDFYERPGKQNQDCHFTIRGGKVLSDGSYQIPIAVLMLNLRPPSWKTPSLLTPQNVDNLFHEMGHAMHSMLARTKYQHVTGTRCSTDFAEVPSILMEYYAADPRILRLFARHYETNLPIPEQMLERLCVSKKLFTACETKMQIFYSVLDQLFHSEDPVLKSDSEVVAEVQEKYYGFKYVPNTAWHLRFSHLVGYGAKYYSYLLSRSVAHSIWHTFFQKNPLDRVNGESYRRGCLAHGGGKNPKKLVADFLKMEVSPTILSNSLVTEIKENHAVVEEYSDKYKIY